MSLKLDLRKFKKIHSDEHSTTLRDPSANHEIKIAHKHIKPEMKAQLDALPHFSDGGKASNMTTAKNSIENAFNKTPAPSPTPQAKNSVQYDQADDPEHKAAVARYKASHPELATGDAYAQGGRVMMADGGACKNPNCPSCGSAHPNCMCYAQGGQVSRCNDPTCLAHGGKVPGRANYADSDSVVSEDDVEPQQSSFGKFLDKAKNVGSQFIGLPGDPEQSSVGDDLMSGIQSVGRQAVGLPSSTPATEEPAAPAPEQTAAAQTPPPSSPALPPQSNPQPSAQPPTPLTQPTGALAGATLDNAYKNQMAGAKGAAGTMKTAYKNQAGVYHDAQTTQATIQKNFQEQLQSLQSERDQLTDDIKNTHIDPNRLYANMETGQKIASILGLIAGGIGGTLSGQGGNQPLAYLNKLSDQDIDAQKADLGKKENLLSANFKKFGDLKEATMMTKIMQADQIASKLGEQAALSNSQLEKSRLLTLQGQIQQGMAPAAQALAMQRAATQAAQDPNVDPTQLIPYKVPKEHQEAVYKEVERAQNTRMAKEAILANFDAVAHKMNSVVGRAGAAVATPPELAALREQLGTTVSDKVGTVRETAMHLADQAYTPDIFRDGQDRMAKRRAELVKYLDLQSAAPRAKSFGVDLDKFKSTSHNPELQFNDQQKKMAQFARNNPQDPRSPHILKKLGIQ